MWHIRRVVRDRLDFERCVLCFQRKTVGKNNKQFASCTRASRLQSLSVTPPQFWMRCDKRCIVSLCHAVLCGTQCSAPDNRKANSARIKVHGQRKLHWFAVDPRLRDRTCTRYALIRTCLIAPSSESIIRKSRNKENTYQTRFVIRRLTLLVHFENRQHEDFGIGFVECWLIPSTDHLQKFGRQIRARVQLDIAREHVESGRGFARYVATHVNWVQQFLLVLVHLRETHVHPRRTERTVVRVGDDLFRRRNLR